jgi:hypothetical protein
VGVKAAGLVQVWGNPAVENLCISTLLFLPTDDTGIPNASILWNFPFVYITLSYGLSV